MQRPLVGAQPGDAPCHVERRCVTVPGLRSSRGELPFRVGASVRGDTELAPASDDG